MRLVSILAAVLLTHCTGDDRPPPAADFDAGPVGGDRAATDVRRPGLDVSPVDPCTLGPCGAEERCGPPRENGMPGSGNGVDDNCDGRVDEGCPCVPGEARACFNAAPDRRGIGACRDGMMVCTELGAWQGNECNGATNCNGAGACSLLAQGSACGAAGECSTGFCVDGFCCNSACTGLCKSCSGAYNLNGDGICGNIECADPQNECSGAATCVGNGTCGANCL